MIEHDGFKSASSAPDGSRKLSLAINKDDFITLSPGESWSDRIPLDDDELFENFKAGERYTFQYVGTVVQWWDWGNLDVSACRNTCAVLSEVLKHSRISKTEVLVMTRRATPRGRRSFCLLRIHLTSW
jgi:hypothetical protein